MRWQIPDDFVRQIARPDDEKLSKRHIGPEDDKRQNQISQLMKVVWVTAWEIGS